MPREFQRSQRVGEQLLRLLGEVVRREVKDPRLEGVSFTAVEATRDLSRATCYFCTLDPDQDPQPAGDALQAAAARIRHHLGKIMHIRKVPELQFRHDDSLARGAHISRLIDEAIARDRGGKG